MDSFDCFPLAAVIDNAFICMHGGLGPDLIHSYKTINAIDRYGEPPMNGLFCDLLWSDPVQSTGGRVEDSQKGGLGYNKVRQCGYVYGAEAT